MNITALFVGSKVRGVFNVTCFRSESGPCISSDSAPVKSYLERWSKQGSKDHHYSNRYVTKHGHGRYLWTLHVSGLASSPDLLHPFQVHLDDHWTPEAIAQDAYGKRSLCRVRSNRRLHGPFTALEIWKAYSHLKTINDECIRSQGWNVRSINKDNVWSKWSKTR